MLRVAVLGLGRIGAGNAGLAPNVHINHVGAILDTPGLQLIAAIDPDARARMRAQSTWGARVPEPWQELSGNVPGADIVAICGTTSGRLAQFSDALRFQPRVIICEKPLAIDAATADVILKLTEERHIPVLVNFNRRFDPSTRAFLDKMTAPPISVHAKYGKGLLNYGSHLVDLLTWRLGPFVDVRALSGRGPGADPIISFHGHLGSGVPVFVEGLRDIKYEVFDVEFSFTDRMLRYADGGSVRRTFQPQPSKVYQGLSFLDATQTELGPISGFQELYTAVRDHLLTGVPLAGCSGAEAMQGQKVLDAIVLSAQGQGSLIRL